MNNSAWAVPSFCEKFWINSYSCTGHLASNFSFVRQSINPSLFWNITFCDTNGTKTQFGNNPCLNKSFYWLITWQRQQSIQTVSLFILCTDTLARYSFVPVILNETIIKCSISILSYHRPAHGCLAFTSPLITNIIQLIA